MNKEFKINYEDVLCVKRRRFVRNFTSKAIRNGQLVKSDSCEMCQNKSYDIESHHVDYGRPLNVIWLCRKCHGRAHRKNSPLNPNNNSQTPMPFLHDMHEKIQISFSIPVKEFVNLLQISKTKGKSMAKLAKDAVLKSYPMESNQLEFNFGEKIDDKSQSKPQQGISGLAKNEVLRKEPKVSDIQEFWCFGDHDKSGMARKLWSVHKGSRSNATKLRRARAV